MNQWFTVSAGHGVKLQEELQNGNSSCKTGGW